MKLTSKHGTKYTAGSSHTWGAGWQVPPVICPGCGVRVTLKQSFFGSFKLGTFHVACAPYSSGKGPPGKD